jgi:hypothetical protein
MERGKAPPATSSNGTVVAATRHVADTTGFTRRCGKRAPIDQSLCMHPYGHDGRHAWDSPQTRPITGAADKSPRR